MAVPPPDSRTNAAIVGVLFIIGSLTGIIATLLKRPVMNAPDYLSRIAANESSVLSSAFFIFLLAIACAGVCLALYSILRRYNIGLAIGVVGFRLLEGMADMLGGLALIALLALSREFVTAGAPDAGSFQTIGAIIQAHDAWINNGVVLVCWCIGAFMYYGIFYRYQLVPRWISVWGLIGITLTTIASVLVMLGVIPGFGTVQMIANLPIMPQEFVFAIWLIAKGIHSPATAALPAQPVTIQASFSN